MSGSVVHGLVKSLHLVQDVLRIVLFRTFPAENPNIEISEPGVVKVQGSCAVRHQMSEIRARPVKHWHEVITYRLDAAFAEILEAEDVFANELIPFRSGIFYGFADREAFHYGPAHTV